MMDRSQFHEHRPDGWPLCPSCGEDELYSRFLPDLPMLDAGPEDALLKAYLESGVKCYRCGWESAEFKVS